MLHYTTIEPDTLELLKAIQSDKALAKFLLVGGTALALQIGHRKSIDLDFFSTEQIDL
ncbi:MAG: nucleotidyl transferase AbiEii/AbiGii toxin family protein, partial [Bacteroidota bacterium]